ncbi:hypothetical protein AAMO2058_000963700 [Amorphochlora amoebiformis]
MTDSKEWKEIDALVPKATSFWGKYFETVEDVSSTDFFKALEKEFKDEPNQEILETVSWLCGYPVSQVSRRSKPIRRVDIKSFHRAIMRFGIPFKDFITNMKRCFFEAKKLSSGKTEYVIYPWYHCFLSPDEEKDLLMEENNENKFLVREPQSGDYKSLTIVYTRVIKGKDGKKETLKGKKKAHWNQKEKLWVWISRSRQQVGHKKLMVGVREMVGDREAIPCEKFLAYIYCDGVYSAADVYNTK